MKMEVGSGGAVGCAAWCDDVAQAQAAARVALRVAGYVGHSMVPKGDF